MAARAAAPFDFEPRLDRIGLDPIAFGRVEAGFDAGPFSTVVFDTSSLKAAVSRAPASIVG
jgi:hypothetical protein